MVCCNIDLLLAVSSFSVEFASIMLGRLIGHVLVHTRACVRARFAHVCIYTFLHLFEYFTMHADVYITYVCQDLRGSEWPFVLD